MWPDLWRHRQDEVNIKPKEFRFYVSHVRLVAGDGHEVPVTLTEGTKWHADDNPSDNPAIYEVTQDPTDVGRLKAPSLRNSRPSTYMQDGSIPTLGEVKDHYSAGDRTITSRPNAGVGASNPNKSESVNRIGFTRKEAAWRMNGSRICSVKAMRKCSRNTHR